MQSIHWGGVNSLNLLPKLYFVHSNGNMSSLRLFHPKGVRLTP